MGKILSFLVPGLILFSLVSHLNGVKLRAEEPRRAMVAIEALESGNYLVPQLNSESYYNKPPFYNWILAGVFKLTGSTAEWAVRLPGILSLVLLGFFSWRLSIPWIPKEHAFLIFLAVLTAGDLYLYASVNAGEIDLFYSLVVFLQVMCIFHFFRKKKYLPLFIFSYLLTAVGFLTKGLPSLAFQAITLISVLGYHRNLKKIFSWSHLAGLFLFMLFSGGYFLIYNQYDDATGFLINLVKESSKKSFNEAGFLSILAHIAEFPVNLAKILFPWSLLLLFLPGKKNLFKNNELYRFSILFFIPNILIYWISPDIRDRYLYMFVPFILYILYLHYLYKGKDGNSQSRIFHLILRVFSILLTLAFLFLPFLDLVPVKRSGFILISLLFSIPAGALTFLLVKKPDQKFFWLAGLMILARFYFNILIIPAIEAGSRSTQYAGIAETIMEISKNEPVCLAGNAEILNPDISILGKPLLETSLRTAPVIGYEFYYYYYRSSGKVMPFKSEPEQGDFCLIYTEDMSSLKSPFSSFLKFSNLSNKKEMQLIRIEGFLESP